MFWFKFLWQSTRLSRIAISSQPSTPAISNFIFSRPHLPFHPLFAMFLLTLSLSPKRSSVNHIWNLLIVYLILYWKITYKIRNGNLLISKSSSLNTIYSIPCEFNKYLRESVISFLNGESEANRNEKYYWNLLSTSVHRDQRNPKITGLK